MPDKEIIAKEKNIKAQAEKMRDLAVRIKAKSFCPEFEQGAGAFVSEMNDLICELKNVGSALSALAETTARQIDSAALEFKAADERASALYRRGE